VEPQPADNGVVESHKAVGGDVVIFRAEEVRRTKTGVHALVTLGFNGIPITADEFNVKRDKDRMHLAGRMYVKATEGLAKEYPKDQLAHDLMLFCLGDAETEGIWQRFVGSQGTEPMNGDTDPSPVSYLLKPYVVEDGGTFLFGKPKAAKSYTALLWAVSVDAGIDKFWEVKQTKVVLINLERSAKSMKKRLARVNMQLGLPPNRPLETKNARGKTLEHVFEGVQRSVNDNAVGLVVLDSLSRAGAGDLNTNEAANDSMDRLNAFGCAWLSIAHTPRSEDSHVFGSQMFDAAADVLVRNQTQLDEDNGNRGVAFTAYGNDVPFAPQRQWTYTFDPDYGLSGVRPATLHEWPDMDVERERSDADVVLDQIFAHGPQSQKQVREDLKWDQTRASRAFSALISKGVIVMGEKVVNEQFWVSAEESLTGDNQ